MKNPRQKALDRFIDSNSAYPRFETKGHAHVYHKARAHKKKLPTFESHKKPKDPSFAKLSIEQYEAKYK